MEDFKDKSLFCVFCVDFSSVEDLLHLTDIAGHVCVDHSSDFGLNFVGSGEEDVLSFLVKGKKVTTYPRKLKGGLWVFPRWQTESVIDQHVVVASLVVIDEQLI